MVCAGFFSPFFFLLFFFEIFAFPEGFDLFDMSRLHLEESTAAVLSLLRSQPTSLIPKLRELEDKFIGVTPIVALTPTRRLR